MLPVLDPCPGIAGCAALTNNPPPLTNCQSYNAHGGTVSLTPGCYNSLLLNNATVTLGSGTYVINGAFSLSKAAISGTGVTIYVTASGTPPNFNMATSAKLTPPTSGPYPGVLYYQVPSNTGNPNFNGTNVSFSGLIYAPGATGVNFNGSSNNYIVVVVGGANFNNTTVNDPGPPSGQSLIKNAVLAQ
jgi:hypothetical protein